VVRICKPKHVQKGEVTPQAFEPVKNEQYLSVHWLEYFQDDSPFHESFDRLRDFLVSSPFKDLKPQKDGRLLALSVGGLSDFRKGNKLVRFKCKHVPRVKPWLKIGHNHSADTPGFDPHSGVYAMPWSGAELLAVQQYLLSKVIYQESGKR
jgi:hypothetical protein